MAQPARRAQFWALIACITTIASDQLTKGLAELYLAELDPWEAVPLIPGHFYVWWTLNPAGFMGFLSADEGAWMGPLLYLLLTAGFCAWIAWRVIRPVGDGPDARAYGLLAGGFIGNGIDRVTRSAVADVLVLTGDEQAVRIAFNLADIAIFVGLGWIVLHTWRHTGSTE